MPDIPGFGGMDSFYKIGQKATLDNYADYMAAFIKMRYKRKRVTIIGISFGFLVATRMFQKYPELTNKVDMLISAVGFMRYDDFLFSKARYRFYRFTPLLFKNPVGATMFRYLGLNSLVLRAVYARTSNAKHKFNEYAGNELLFNAMMEMEIKLWQQNDVRTYMQTAIELLKVDNCKVQVDLPVWHVYTKHDHFFDNAVIEQQMKVVFREFHGAVINIQTHAPSILASKKASAMMIPNILRQELRGTRAPK